MSIENKVKNLRSEAQTTQAANKIIDQLKKLENSNGLIFPVTSDGFVR